MTRSSGWSNRTRYRVGGGLLTAAGAIGAYKHNRHKAKSHAKNAVKHKERNVASYTKTKTKSNERISADDLHSGLSEKHVVIRLNKPLKHKCKGKWKYSQNWASQITQTSGDQFVALIAGMCQRNQLLVSTVGPNVLQLREALFDLNPATKLPGSALIPANNIPATDRIAVFRVRHNMLFTNFESTSVVLYLYYITPKKDVIPYADQAWATGLSAASGEGLNVAARTRAAPGVYGGTTVGSCSINDVFQKPGDCRVFTDLYRIIKVKKIKLAAGATEEVVSTVHVNKIVNRAAVQDNGVDNVKGLTCQIMAVAYSQVVDDQTAGVNPTPTTGPVNIGYVGTSTYFCGMTAAAVNRVDDFFTQQQMAEAVAIANERIINVTDIVAAVVGA
jgi:hypothetical protein